MGQPLSITLETYYKCKFWAPPQTSGIWSARAEARDSVLRSSPQDSGAQIGKVLLNRGRDRDANEQSKEGWERSEEEHLEPPPAGLTLSASGQAANAKERKAKSGAYFQERGLLPDSRMWSQNFCLQRQASSRTGTTRTVPQPSHVSFDCWILKMTRHLIFHQCRRVRSNELLFLN